MAQFSVLRARGPGQTIRAEVLRSVLVGPGPIAASGVRLRGVKIKGTLNLEGAAVRCPLRLCDCYFDGDRPAFSFATFSVLELKHCLLDGLAAQSLVVSKRLDLSNSTFTGTIELDASEVAGWFICTGAKLEGRNKDRYSLSAEGMTVGGGVILDKTKVTNAVNLSGARITGQLKCTGSELNGKDEQGNSLVANRITVGRAIHLDEGFTAAGAVRLPGADITGQLNCKNATLNGRDDRGYALSAFMTRIDGDVILDEISTTAGAVEIFGADVTGRFRCLDARFDGTDARGYALVASQVKVGVDLSLDGVQTKDGAIQLTGAVIGGQLTCRKTERDLKDRKPHLQVAVSPRVNSPSVNSLIADSVVIRDRLIISDFTAVGTVRLAGAKIGGRLQCSNAELNGQDKYGRALLADGMTVGGGAWFAGVRTSRGVFRMVGAEITGDLHYQGIRLASVGDHRDALIADRIKVTGSVFFRPGQKSGQIEETVADGSLSLRSARIGGSLELKPSRLAGGSADDRRTALDLTGAQIAHDLTWEPDQAVTGTVILEGASAGQLKDRLDCPSKGNWPPASDGRLRLDGFTYGRISDAQQVDWRRRLAWLGSPDKSAKKKKHQAGRKGQPEPAADNVKKQRVFASQPYEQLAKVYRRAGQDKESREVAIARRRDLRRYGDLTPYRKFGNWMVDWTIRYGYRTWRTVVGLVAFYGAAVLIFALARRSPHLIIPIQVPASLHTEPTALHCTSTYPCFNPFSYAVDTVVPIINVHQATFWGPNGNAPLGHLLVAFTWIATVLGWALATLVIAGYTGLVRRD